MSNKKPNQKPKPKPLKAAPTVSPARRELGELAPDKLAEQVARRLARAEAATAQAQGVRSAGHQVDALREAVERWREACEAQLEPVRRYEARAGPLGPGD